MNTLEIYLNEALEKEKDIPLPVDCSNLSVEEIVMGLTTTVNVQR